MKLKELVEKYGEYDVILSERIAKNEIRIEGRKPEPKSVFELKTGEAYYYITSDGNSPYEGNWNDDYHVPSARRKYGNVFRTKEEAEKEIERREVETLLLEWGGRRWYKVRDNWIDKNLNWTIWYNDVSEKLKICHGAFAQGAIYFDSIEKAENAIEEIGADRIIEALFDCRW